MDNKEYQRQWYARNRDKAKEYQQQWEG